MPRIIQLFWQLRKVINMTTNENMSTKEWRNTLTDSDYTRVFLDVALEEYEKDGDTEAFLLSLRDVTEAQGGIGKLAERTNLNRQNLYKALSEKGNPRLETIGAILHGLGFRLSVEPVKDEELVKVSE